MPVVRSCIVGPQTMHMQRFLFLRQFLWILRGRFCLLADKLSERLLDIATKSGFVSQKCLNSFQTGLPNRPNVNDKQIVFFGWNELHGTIVPGLFLSWQELNVNGAFMRWKSSVLFLLFRRILLQFVSVSFGNWWVSCRWMISFPQSFVIGAGQKSCPSFLPESHNCTPATAKKENNKSQTAAYKIAKKATRHFSVFPD